MYIQQGDTLYKSGAKIPESAKKLDTNIVQEGELTGHAHRLHGGEFQLYQTDNGVKFLKVVKETEVRHEEHNAFAIPEGTYEIGIVREYDHWAEESRQVVD